MLHPAELIKTITKTKFLGRKKRLLQILLNNAIKRQLYENHYSCLILARLPNPKN